MKSIIDKILQVENLLCEIKAELSIYGVKTISSDEGKTEDKAIPIFLKYEQLIGLLTPAVSEGIDFALENGMEVELIIRIIEYACEQNKRNWQWINKALLGNLKDNIKTLADYNRRQTERLERAAKPQTKTIAKRSKFNNYDDANKRDYSNLGNEILKEMLEE